MAECTYCPFQNVVNAVSELIKTYRVTPGEKPRDGAKIETLTLNPIQYSAYKSKKKKVRKVAMDCDADFRRIVADIENNLLPRLQKVCLQCSKESNDDNLSRHGQTFVFMEAMCTNGLSGNAATPGASLDEGGEGWDGVSGGTGESLKSDGESDPFFADSDADYAEPDNRQTSSDWLHKNVAVDTHYLDPDGCTKLPTHIEDQLRKHFHSFAQLSVFEQNLVISQILGQSFSDFGTMSWVPPDMKKPQSKQLISVRWDKLVKKFPLAEALRKSKVAKEIQKTSSARKKNYSKEQFVQEAFDLDSIFEPC